MSIFNISIEANIVDPDQTAPKGAVWSGSTLFVYEASNVLVDVKKNPYILWLWALRGNKCEFSVYTVNFHEMHVPLRGRNNLLILHQIINGTWFPLLRGWNSGTTPRYEYYSCRLYSKRKVYL